MTQTLDLYLMAEALIKHNKKTLRYFNVKIKIIYKKNKSVWIYSNAPLNLH